MWFSHWAVCVGSRSQEGRAVHLPHTLEDLRMEKGLKNNLMEPSSLTYSFFFFFLAICFYRSQTKKQALLQQHLARRWAHLGENFWQCWHLGGGSWKEVSLKEHLPVNRVAFGSLWRMGAPSCSAVASSPPWTMFFSNTALTATWQKPRWEEFSP